MTNARPVSVCGRARPEDENIRPPGRADRLEETRAPRRLFLLPTDELLYGISHITPRISGRPGSLSPPFPGAVFPLASARARQLVGHVVSVAPVLRTALHIPHGIVDLPGEGDDCRGLLVYIPLVIGSADCPTNSKDVGCQREGKGSEGIRGKGNDDEEKLARRLETADWIWPRMFEHLPGAGRLL